MEQFERTWIEVDLDKIRNNYRSIRRAFEGVKVMSVLKGDAYGHGIRGILPACEPNTDWFAVATVDEAKQIRDGGGTKPVLLLGPVPRERLAEAISQQLTFTVGSADYAQAIRAAAQRLGTPAQCHLKIDTGLNRTGFSWREGQETAVQPQLAAIFEDPMLNVTGVYTHLACPESEDEDDIRFTQQQVDGLLAACRWMEEAGYDPGLRHCASTGGALIHPEYRLDMVRTGMMVYGQCDSQAHLEQWGLQQAMCWKSSLIQIRPVAAGESVSYSRTFRAPRDMIVGVVGCGYADGYRRNYQKNGTAIVGGKIVKIVGRICMDYLLVDLTGVEQPEIGMEVVLMGRQGEAEISTIAMAEAMESVCGEITVAISARVPRKYRNL